MSKRLQFDWKALVKHFLGAERKCMKDYLKPSLQEDPNHFVLHVGTNYLSTESSPELWKNWFSIWQQR